MKKFWLVAPVGLLVLASACNDDDGSGNGGGLTEDQQAAVDQLMAIQEEEGLAFDRACVEEKAAQLSDEDASAIAEAGPDGDAELSADGQALSRELFDCVDEDAMVELLVEELSTSSGGEVDEDCVRDALEGVDLGGLVVALQGGEDIGEGSDTATAVLALMACFNGLGDGG